MSHLTAICNALDFVEEHLTKDVTVADMADAACYSLYHFSRTFNRVVHLTPYDYLMRRRLSESARQLIETDKKIIEIAFYYDSTNTEIYTRAFKRLVGMLCPGGRYGKRRCMDYPACYRGWRLDSPQQSWPSCQQFIHRTWGYDFRRWLDPLLRF